MKRLLSAGLAVCLAAALAGCQSTGTTPQPIPAPTSSPQTLAVYYEHENPAAAHVLDAYAQAQHVTVTVADSLDTAGLAVLDAVPTDGFLSLTAEDALLAAAVANAGVESEPNALPLGKSLYGYWADSTVLTALLGSENAVADLQNADWEEWADFVEILGSWLNEPAAAEVTLSGTAYTLPAEKAGAAAQLSAVFALPQDAFCGSAYTVVLLASDGATAGDAIVGPLNGLANTFRLETAHAGANGTPTALLGEKSAVFYRGRLTDLTAALPLEQCQTLVVIPQKCYLEEEDLSTEEYNLNGLLNFPVMAQTGRLAIPASADADSAKAGKSFLLWLYTGKTAEAVLTDELCMLTPWRMASDETALGAMQIELLRSGVLPGVELSGGVNEALKAAMPQEFGGQLGTMPLIRADFAAAAQQALDQN